MWPISRFFSLCALLGKQNFAEGLRLVGIKCQVISVSRLGLVKPGTRSHSTWLTALPSNPFPQPTSTWNCFVPHRKLQATFRRTVESPSASLPIRKMGKRCHAVEFVPQSCRLQDVLSGHIQEDLQIIAFHCRATKPR